MIKLNQHTNNYCFLFTAFVYPFTEYDFQVATTTKKFKNEQAPTDI